MTTEGKVSPLPWRVDPQHRADIQTVDGRELATLWNEEAVGMTLQNATGGAVAESQLTAAQARLLRKRGFVVLGS